MLDNAVALTLIGICLFIVGMFVAYVVAKRREATQAARRLGPQQKGPSQRHMELGE